LRKKIRELDRLSVVAFAALPGDFATSARLGVELLELRSKDPSPLSASLRTSMWEAAEGNLFNEAAKYRDQLQALKRFLPEYQLAGAWQASINIPGALLGEINVRIYYDDDTLTAMDPDGAVLFMVDVSESHENTYRHMEYFKGASGDFGRGSIEGQLYLMGHDVIGFLWLGKGAAERGELLTASAGQAGKVFVRFQRRQENVPAM